MDLILLRHTRVDLPQGICYGASDVALADDRDEVFARIAWQIPRGWSRIIASPLQRCRALAEHLADGRAVVYDERLREIDFGSWELQRWDAIPEDEYRAWGDDWVHVAPPGGESLQQLAQRVEACLRDIIAQGEDSLVVCHGGPIRMALAGLLGLTLREAMSQPIDRGHHYQLHSAAVADPWTVIAANSGPDAP